MAKVVYGRSFQEKFPVTWLIIAINFVFFAMICVLSGYFFGVFFVLVPVLLQLHFKKGGYRMEIIKHWFESSDSVPTDKFPNKIHYYKRECWGLRLPLIGRITLVVIPLKRFQVMEWK